MQNIKIAEVDDFYILIKINMGWVIIELIYWLDIKIEHLRL